MSQSADAEMPKNYAEIDERQRKMAGVKVRGHIEAKWEGDQVTATVTSAPQLASVAIKLLVEDLGTDEARQHIRDELSEYLMDYQGAGKDSRGAKKGR